MCQREAGTHIEPRHHTMALQSGVLGSLTLETRAQRLARSASTVAVSPTTPQGASCRGGRGGVRTNRDSGIASGTPLGNRAGGRHLGGGGGGSTGIHSPWRGCHFRTPPASLHFTLHQTKFSSKVSQRSMLLVGMPGHPADVTYLPTYAVWDSLTQSQVRHTSCLPASSTSFATWPLGKFLGYSPK